MTDNKDETTTDDRFAWKPEDVNILSAEDAAKAEADYEAWLAKNP